jgi:NADH-quinone oxidoreductase subunit C
MSITHDFIKEKLNNQFGDKILSWDESYGMLSATVQHDHNLKVLTFLHDETSLGFQFLTDITGVHYPDRKGEEIAVVYHVHNLKENVRLRLKIFVPIEKPDVFIKTLCPSNENPKYSSVLL